MAPKQKYNFRLSDEAKRLLETMSAEMGIPQTNVLELAIREKAAAMKKKAPPSDPHALPSFGSQD